MQCDGLEEHVTASVDQVLLEVLGLVVDEVDALHRHAEQEARLLRGPGDVDLLRTDAARHAAFGAGRAEFAVALGRFAQATVTQPWASAAASAADICSE